MEFLQELCSDYGYDCEKTGDHIINHPYTQKDIASLIGISRPTLNILMNELKEADIIDFFANAAGIILGILVARCFTLIFKVQP